MGCLEGVARIVEEPEEEEALVVDLGGIGIGRVGRGGWDCSRPDPAGPGVGLRPSR